MVGVTVAGMTVHAVYKVFTGFEERFVQPLRGESWGSTRCGMVKKKEVETGEQIQISRTTWPEKIEVRGHGEAEVRSAG
jgi:hypothetical protein